MTGQQPEKQTPSIAHLNMLGQEGVIFAHQTLHFFVVISHFPLPNPPQVFLPLKAHQFLLANLLLFAKDSFGPASAQSSCFNFSSSHFLHPSPQLCSGHESQSWPQCCSSPAGCLCPETLMQCKPRILPSAHCIPSHPKTPCVLKKTHMGVKNKVLVEVQILEPGLEHAFYFQYLSPLLGGLRRTPTVLLSLFPFCPGP